MNPAVPLIRAAPVRAFAAFLERGGAPVESLLERAKLSPRIMSGDAETLVPLAAVARFLEDAARSQGVDDLGIRMGVSIHVQQLGMFGGFVAGARTLREGLECAFRAWRAYSSGERSWLTLRGDLADVHHQFLHEDGPRWQHATAFTLAVYLNYIAAAGGPGWYPATVGLPLRALPGARSLRILASARLEFRRPWTTITLAASVLDRPLPRLRGAASRVRSPEWENGMPADDVGGAVQQVVATLLPDGYPDIRLVAEAVSLSPRTLQRRLHAEGATFAGVVARARFAEARRMLREPARKIIDVALDLGYSDPAHFTRAFERWAGIAPRDFRRRMIDGANPKASDGA